MSEREAARMLERMRATEEDEEFERAFRSMVRSCAVRATPVCPTVLHLHAVRLQVHESVQGVRTVGTFKSAGTDRMAIPGEILTRPFSIDGATEWAEMFRMPSILLRQAMRWRYHQIAKTL